MQFKVEHDTYPYLEAYYKRLGYLYQRIEANTSVPDIFICGKGTFNWVEVKMYRGSKALEAIVSANDLVWKPGQLLFRKKMIDSGCKENYMLVICDGEEFRFIRGGLER